MGGGEEVDRAVSRKQRELCKLLFDTRLILCLAFLNSEGGGENLLIYRCSIEPEDIPFQGFDGGAIVACLLEVNITHFSFFSAIRR